MRYIKPEIVISSFDVEDIITTSGNSNNVFNALDETTTYSATQAVDVGKVITRE